MHRHCALPQCDPVRLGFWPGLVLLAIGSAAAAGPVPPEQPHREATGWLELEQDQRQFRERIEPLDLRDERVLETIEGSQRIDLREVQQRQARDLEQQQRDLRRQRQQAAPTEVPPPARRTPGFRQQRALERQRLERQMEQRRLPFDRR